MLQWCCFNPNPRISILAVGYWTCVLAIFDSWSQEIILSTKTDNGNQSVPSLASSLDGRTLATVDFSGTMQIWDFETLVLLYQIRSSDCGSRVIHFNCNGLQILDLTGLNLRIWEPAALFRKTLEGDGSVSDAAVLSAIGG